MLDLEFLKSNRFWVAVAMAIALYLKAKGWIGVAETTLIETLGGIFIGVRTVDRLGDNLK